MGSPKNSGRVCTVFLAPPAWIRRDTTNIIRRRTIHLETTTYLQSGRPVSRCPLLISFYPSREAIRSPSYKGIYTGDTNIIRPQARFSLSGLLLRNVWSRRYASTKYVFANFFHDFQTFSTRYIISLTRCIYTYNHPKLGILSALAYITQWPPRDYS